MFQQSVSAAYTVQCTLCFPTISTCSTESKVNVLYDYVQALKALGLRLGKYRGLGLISNEVDIDLKLET